MIKKVIMDSTDKQILCYKWDRDRLKRYDEKIYLLENDKENQYLISVDIAHNDANDNSVMMRFKLVDNQYIYDGYEMI